MSYRAGFVGIVGEPNAGKSTLFNQLIRERISIISAKPQTTRRRVLGIVSKPEGQVVFFDSPGLTEGPKGLNAFLKDEAAQVIQDSEVLLLVVALDEKNKESFKRNLELVSASKKPWAVVITKLDLIDYRQRILVIHDMVKLVKADAQIFEYSDQWGKDRDQVVNGLVSWSLSALPVSAKGLYDEENFTTHSVRELCSEIIREQCFEMLEQELPYSVAVRINHFDESNKDLPRIMAEIIVSKSSHQGMVVGSGGQMIKMISSKSRAQIEKLMQQKVFLKIDVKTEEDWMNDSRLMKELGYSLVKN